MDGRVFQCSAVKVRLSDGEDQSELQTRLQGLAREITNGLSELEPAQGKELLGSFVSELFLSVAKQDQMDYRRKKQAEGIAAAKIRGVRFGPQPKPLPDKFDECYQAWQEGEMTQSQAAKICGISRQAFRRAIARAQQLENRAG